MWSIVALSVVVLALGAAMLRRLGAAVASSPEESVWDGFSTSSVVERRKR